MGANFGAEIFGVEAWVLGGDVVRFRDDSGIVGLETGVLIVGEWRLSDSSMLEVSCACGGTTVGSDFVNGVTSLKEGGAGAGFTVCLIFSVGRGGVCGFRDG